MSAWRSVLPVVGWACILLAVAPLEAQQFGQWSWNAVIGAEGRDTENSTGGEATSTYGTQSILVGLGINGFIVHPAVARFNLRLDTWLTQYSDGVGTDNSKFGGRFDLGLLERGTMPIRLYFGKAQYQYSELTSDDPTTLLGGLPESTTNWGGRLRVRRGVLRGLLVGVDASDLEFRDPGARPESNERLFADWGRSTGNIQHHLHLVRETRDYSRVNYALETTTLTWEEHGTVAPTWRWDLSGVGIGRRTQFEGVGSTESTTARLRNRFIHEFEGGDTLDLGYGFGYASAGGGDSAMDHSIDARYRRRLVTGWEVAPYVAVTLRDVGEGSASIVQGGASVNRTWASGPWSGSFSGTGALGRNSLSGEAGGSQSFWTTSVSGLVSHGVTSGLRKEIEIGFSRNEVRSVGEGDADLPDLGVGFAAAGTQDMSRARLSLFHDWRGGGVSGWAEWRSRRTGSTFDGLDLRADDLLATAQFRLNRFSVVANAGRTEIDTLQQSGQELTYIGGSVTWNPWRSLRVTTSYRQDVRRLDLVPDVDSDRLQATVEFRLGRLSVQGQLFRYDERPTGGLERRNQGIFWSVRRNLAGWLPWVTGPQRRGVIR